MRLWWSSVLFLNLSPASSHLNLSNVSYYPNGGCEDRQQLDDRLFLQNVAVPLGAPALFRVCRGLQNVQNQTRLVHSSSPSTFKDKSFCVCDTQKRFNSPSVCVCVLRRAKINRQLSHNIHLGVYVCLISTKKCKKKKKLLPL